MSDDVERALCLAQEKVAAIQEQWRAARWRVGMALPVQQAEKAESQEPRAIVNHGDCAVCRRPRPKKDQRTCGGAACEKAWVEYLSPSYAPQAEFWFRRAHEATTEEDVDVDPRRFVDPGHIGGIAR